MVYVYETEKQMLGLLTQRYIKSYQKQELLRLIRELQKNFIGFNGFTDNYFKVLCKDNNIAYSNAINKKLARLLKDYIKNDGLLLNDDRHNDKEYIIKEVI